MENYTDLYKVGIPKPNKWPGVFGSYKLVKPNIKIGIWNIFSVIGLGVIFLIIAEFIFSAFFHQKLTITILVDIVEYIAGAFMQVSIIYLYFNYLNGREVKLSETLHYGYSHVLKMIGLLIVMSVVLIASLIFLIVPFFYILPRIYLAPYLLVADNLKVNQAIGSSWHLTKNNSKKVYGIIGINLLLALLFLTFIGIPFAIYWGVINSASFALLTLYLLQPKTKKNKKVKLS